MLRTFPLPSPPVRPQEATPPQEQARPQEPRPVRDAATVMLVRDGSEGVEVFVFRRLRSMAFAAGMVVFPGGATEEQDDDPELAWSPVEGERATTCQLPSRLVVAAVRETFEECGVLLAPPTGPESSPLDPAELETLRLGLLDGRIRFAEVLRRTGRALDPGRLHHWAHWITPALEPRRFDTRFFVARVPADQEPRDLGGEGEHAAWLAARQAVARYHAGDLPMMPPTLVCMEELAAAGDVDTLLRTERQVSPVSPWVVHRPGEDGTVVAELHIDLDGRGGGRPRS